VKRHSPAANNPAHRRIMTQASFNVLISSETIKHRLTQQTDRCMAAVLACARIGKCLDRHRRQAECIIQFAVRQQSGIGGDHGPTELEHQAMVEIEPKNVRFRFTRRVRHDRPRSDDIRR
jgi:hypothetical protein